MAEVASAFVTLLPSMANFNKKLDAQMGPMLDKSGTSGGKRFSAAFASTLKIGMLAGGVAVAAFGKAAVGAASDAQQSIGATQTVFSKFSKAVIGDSNKAAQQFGLSANSYRENANLIGSLFKNQGVSTEQLAGKTKQMIGVGADLAATFGGTTTDAVGALGAAFKGEYDSLERYGVSLKESTVSALLAKRGQDKLTGASLAGAKQQAVTDLIMRQSKDSLGAFGKESNTLAGQQQRLGAQFENIKAKVGTLLLPVLTRFAGFLNSTLLPGISKMGPIISAGAATIKILFSGLSSGTGEAGSKFAQFQATVATVWASVKSIFTSSVAIVSALWGAFGGTLTTYAQAAFTNVMLVFRGAFTIIQGMFQAFSSLLKGDWSGVWDGIKLILSGAWLVIQGLVRQGWNLIQTAFRFAGTVIKGIFTGIWDGLKGLAEAGMGKVVDAVRAIPGKLRDLGGKFKDAGAGLIEKLIDGIGNAAGFAANFAGKIWDALKSAINGGIDSLNRKLEFSFDTHIPGVGKVAIDMPDIGHLYKGTKNWGGGLTWVGEKGPELLNLPRGSQVLSNRESMAALRVPRAPHLALDNLSSSSKPDKSGITNHFHVTAPAGIDEPGMARLVANQIMWKMT